MPISSVMINPNLLHLREYIVWRVPVISYIQLIVRTINNLTM